MVETIKLIGKCRHILLRMRSQGYTNTITECRRRRNCTTSISSLRWWWDTGGGMIRCDISAGWRGECRGTVTLVMRRMQSSLRTGQNLLSSLIFKGGILCLLWVIEISVGWNDVARDKGVISYINILEIIMRYYLVEYIVTIQVQVQSSSPKSNSKVQFLSPIPKSKVQVWSVKSKI